MREEDSSWFSRWEEQLPSPEELTPLSQTLITPDLALAFDLPPPGTTGSFNSSYPHRRSSPAAPPSSAAHQADFDSSSGGAASDEPARTLKRPRLVWTPQLHKRFVDAVAHLGIKNAVPKTIMQLMSVDGLTRENVASHLQKYRLYLKRMQGTNNAGSATGGSGDPATDHLFASSPVPPHFLHPQGYVPPPSAVAALHHQQMAAMAAGGQYHHHRQMGQFGSPPGGSGGQYEHPFLPRQAQIGGRVSVGTGGVVSNSAPDLESATAANGRKVLTLFPTAEN